MVTHRQKRGRPRCGLQRFPKVRDAAKACASQGTSSHPGSQPGKKAALLQQEPRAESQRALQLTEACSVELNTPGPQYCISEEEV